MANSVDQDCILPLLLATDAIAGDQNFWKKQEISPLSEQLESGSGVCRGWQQDTTACKILEMPAGVMPNLWL